MSGHDEGRWRDSRAHLVRPIAGLSSELLMREIVERLGPAHAETGSGLCIFVWRATDGREFWVATNHCGLDEVPVYAGFR